MRASVALTALAMEPCSRAVSIFFPELKRPLLRPAVAENVSCCCGMDTAGGWSTWLDGWRHERAQLRRSSRHALTAPRCPPAPEPRVCSLRRCSVDIGQRDASCATTASARPGGSSAGAAGRSNRRLLLLWLAPRSSAITPAHLQHTGKAAPALCVCVMCYVPVTKNPALYKLVRRYFSLVCPHYSGQPVVFWACLDVPTPHVHPMEGS